MKFLLCNNFLWYLNLVLGHRNIPAGFIPPRNGSRLQARNVMFDGVSVTRLTREDEGIIQDMIS